MLTKGPAKKVTIFINEDTQHNLTALLDIAGATVYRGILGYGAKGHEHKQSFFHVSKDMPIMVSVIDSAEKIAAAAEAIEGMLEDGLIVISEAEIVRLVRSQRIAEASDATGSTR